MEIIKEDENPVKSTNESNIKQKEENQSGIQLTDYNPKSNDTTSNKQRSNTQNKHTNKSQHSESTEEKEMITIPESNNNIDASQSSEEKQSEKKCCECFDPDLFRATMSIILFFLYWFSYLGDIATMLTLMIPQHGGGITGCICDSINTMSECMDCWNCVWPDTDTQECINFDSKINIIQLAFPILFGYCTAGWLINEITVWIRVCIACTTYSKEIVKYRERRGREIDEFVKDNAGHLLRSKIAHTTNQHITIHKQETLIQYQTNYNNDIMGLVPCCFEDIDEYHMKQILVFNTEQDAILHDSSYEIDDNLSNIKKCCKFPADISGKCCEFPLFMVAFSLSLCWLFPFRYFWELAICDLRSKIWKRACWFGVFHLILFDVCWMLFCWFTYNLLYDAKARGMNSYIDDLSPWLERKFYDSFIMIIVMVIIWFVIPSYLITNTSRNNVYSPVRLVRDN